jgi:hypothetical protein
VPDLLTEITEIVTGLGMTGFDNPEEALAARPSVMENVTEAHWDRLDAAWAEKLQPQAFADAWANGRAFFESADGLRGRVPIKIEWKGSHQPPGFDFIPVDLRIDHVYLVSCKYLSKILANSSPSNLFMRRLADRTAAADTTSWYAVTAPREYEYFYSCVRRYVGQHLLPATPQELTPAQTARIQSACGRTWPKPLAPVWAEFSLAVASESASRWLAVLPTPARREEMVWRLLRLNASSYFVLGSSGSGPIRLRIGTPWDWRQTFVFRNLQLTAVAAGQPKVVWSAQLVDTRNGVERCVNGHVEIRWAHGRFSSVEAKIYLDTPHTQVPGYFPLSSPGEVTGEVTGAVTGDASGQARLL